MSTRPNPLFRLRPDGLDYVVDSDPDTLRKSSDGTPNVVAIARAAGLSKGAWSRVVNGTRPGAGLGTVRRVAAVAAKPRGITIDEAQAMIFELMEEPVAA